MGSPGEPEASHEAPQHPRQEWHPLLAHDPNVVEPQDPRDRSTIANQLKWKAMHFRGDLNPESSIPQPVFVARPVFPIFGSMTPLLKQFGIIAAVLCLLAVAGLVVKLQGISSTLHLDPHALMSDSG